MLKLPAINADSCYASGMNELTFYHLLKDANEDTRLKLIAEAIEDAKRMPIVDLSRLSTKDDLKDLEIRILKTINDQTWKFLGGITLLGFAFKLAEMFLK